MSYLYNTISISEKGSAGGVASLDSSGDVPVGQLDNGLPDQSGESGKYLATDGTSASWGSGPYPLVSADTSSSGSITLENNGTLDIDVLGIYVKGYGYMDPVESSAELESALGRTAKNIFLRSNEATTTYTLSSSVNMYNDLKIVGEKQPNGMTTASVGLVKIYHATLPPLTTSQTATSSATGLDITTNNQSLSLTGLTGCTGSPGDIFSVRVYGTGLFIPFPAKGFNTTSVSLFQDFSRSWRIDQWYSYPSIRNVSFENIYFETGGNTQYSVILHGINGLNLKNVYAHITGSSVGGFLCRHCSTIDFQNVHTVGTNTGNSRFEHLNRGRISNFGGDAGSTLYLSGNQLEVSNVHTGFQHFDIELYNSTVNNVETVNFVITRCNNTAISGVWSGGVISGSQVNRTSLINWELESPANPFLGHSGLTSGTNFEIQGETTTVTGAATIYPGVSTVLVNDTTAVTITLSTALLDMLQTITIKDISGNASANNITIATEGAETIDGSATLTISQNYGSGIFVSNGTNWYVI